MEGQSNYVFVKVKLKLMCQELEFFFKEYGMLQKFDDSKKFLMDGNTHLGEYQTSFYYFWGFCNGPKCTRLNDLLTD